MRGENENKIAELMEEKARAESANRAKNLFFASVSREIRTPMNVVAGMAELLSEDGVTAEQFEKISTIKTYSDIMLGLIDDLLDFSRITDGKFILEPEHYYFPSLLEKIIGTARTAAHCKNLTFTTELPLEIPCYLFGDCVRLSRALKNLLLDSINFTEKGSVTLNLQVDNAEKLLKFSIRDTGVGIKPEDRGRLLDIFEPRLAITDSIISAMNGKLTVESVYEAGSTFKIELPFELGDEKQAEAGADADSYNNHVSAPEARVLLVDDIDVNLMVGIGFMKLHDINPDTAVSAKEAIKKVCEKEYDIVFMDHMMPGTDGGKASEIIRSFGGRYAKSDDIDDRKNLKIIALTASVTPEAKALMFGSGMDDFIPKPVTKQALNQMLMKWLPSDKYEIIHKRAPAGFESRVENFPIFLEAAQKAAGLDIQSGFRLCGGTAEAFENSLRLLNRRIPKSIEKLEGSLKSYKAERFREFAVEAHGMKGALAINGLDDLSALAYELELAGKSKNAEACTRYLPDFIHKLTALSAALSEVFTDETDVFEKKQGDKEELETIITRLIIIIERFDRGQALIEIEYAQGFDFGSRSNKLFELLKADLYEYDYDSAMEKLQNFKELNYEC
jgi:CheY-like chemotaxis protein